MKLTEKDLMLGDLISCKSIMERYAKITEIYKQLEPPFKQMVSLRTKGLRYCMSIDEIDPIPLTPEILEKNGFVKINSQRYDLGEYESDCYIKVNPKRGWIHVNGKNANCNLYSHKYVHELQHALRLCGLTELADSFKVI